MPARRGIDGFSKEERIALLLNALYDRPQHRATTEQLRRQLDPYHAATGTEPGEADLARWERTIDRDVEDLVERGLAERSHPTDGEADSAANLRSMVSLRMPDKPQRLMLTPREHAALAKARQGLRPGPPMVSPLRVWPTRDLDHLDLAMITLRYLEETGASVTVAELAEHLDRDARTVRSALEHLADIDSALVSSCMLVIDYDDDRITGVSIATTRLEQPGHRTGRGGGMNPLARFAYTRDEARERIALIDEALAARDLVDDEDSAALYPARQKLEEWIRLLDRALAGGHG